MKRVRVVAITAAALFVAAAASAQSPYAGAALLGDIVRSTHSESPAARGETGGGEAIGFALRAGTRVGAIWGVEVEFARPSLIEEEGGGPIALPAPQSITFDPSFPRGLTPAIFPPIVIGVRTSQRHTTLSAVAWAEQLLSARVSLVYLGGVAFARSQRDYTATYSPLAGGVSLVIPYVTETVIYGVGPVAGFEARLALTDRAQLVPGIRLQAVDHTWLVRPSVGISWTF